MMVFLLLAAILAPLNWYAVLVGDRRLERVAKPGTMVCLTLWFASHLRPSVPVAGGLFVLGMLLSLAGDVFLLLDRRHFVKGLLAFLLAHLAYIAVYNLHGLLLDGRAIAAVLPMLVVVLMLLRRIASALRAGGQAGLVPAVVVYGIVLMLTFWSTTVTLLRPTWSSNAALYAAAGGGLFFLSDSILAWDRFVHPLPRGRFWTMLSYHAAQFLLASSLLAFLELTP